MGFFSKLKSAIRRIKGKLIVSAILVLVIIVWAIAPFTVALKNAMDAATGKSMVDWATLITDLGIGITKPLDSFL